MDEKQFDRMRNGVGFVAALDQSGGSTPGALHRYGIERSAYASEAEMFDLVHEMRARIMTSPVFDGDRIIGAILFEDTMNRSLHGQPTAQYLWQRKRIVPILKVDKGLEGEVAAARLMKPVPDLEDLLARARSHGIFGTKMRSVISAPGEGVDAVVAQQFALALRIIAAGLVPIIEPEVDIHAPDKARAEELLKAGVARQLDALSADQLVMLKLTPPDVDDFYRDLVEHPNVLRVLLLSGGYSRAEANARLARNHGAVASFSRALTEGLHVTQTEDEFDAVLDESISSIADASRT
ncbi:fructose bisphosphate aldolase [Georgenia satyanarayanai]|uniref:fructose bisphosphate aldolase n=1 Tax=Georgenia satyanarayanai TaxID=860221 RepID=UPI0012645E32|nr:fructose bisphosphate aldolase [Georgenia satyanarayanai]